MPENMTSEAYCQEDRGINADGWNVALRNCKLYKNIDFKQSKLTPNLILAHF